MLNFNSQKCIIKRRVAEVGQVGSWAGVITSWKDCSKPFKPYKGVPKQQQLQEMLATLPSQARTGVEMVFDKDVADMNPGKVAKWTNDAARGWCLYGRYQDQVLGDPSGYQPGTEMKVVPVPRGDTSYDEKITWCEEQCMRFDTCKAYITDLNKRTCSLKTRIDAKKKSNRASMWTGRRECCGKDPGSFAEQDLERVAPVDMTDDPVVLIVGSTDGSGSRGVVNQLMSLGVDMIVNDPVQFDVGGQEFYGWPPLVNRVFAQLHSGNFNLTDAFMKGTEGFMRSNPNLKHEPEDILEDSMRQALNFTMGQLGEFLRKMDGLHRGVTRKTNKLRRTKHVLWGLKAPVSMMLLPLWYYLSPLPFARKRKRKPLQPGDEKLLGRFKFIHVMRDGRDIAFSANQSPVDKFFKTYFKDSSARWNLGGAQAKQRRAIDIWSEWNVEVRTV
jgi:hypothetical protein